MIVYKLFRKLKNGDITSLFINKQRALPYNEWMIAESFPTKGFKVRPFWHSTENPIAPHLSMKNRVWLPVEIKEYTEFNRPISQGGKWFLSKYIKILKEEDDKTKKT